MAAVNEVLVDGFNRVQETVHEAVEGLSAEQLAQRVGPEANTIAWLVWHLARVEDDHVSELAGTDQVWTSEGWAKRFELPFAESATIDFERPENLRLGLASAASKITFDDVKIDGSELPP